MPKKWRILFPSTIFFCLHYEIFLKLRNSFSPKEKVEKSGIRDFHHKKLTVDRSGISYFRKAKITIKKAAFAISRLAGNRRSREVVRFFCLTGKASQPAATGWGGELV